MRIIPFQIPRQNKGSFLVQEDRAPNLYPHFHQHSEIQLTLIKEGDGTLVAGDFVGTFNSGDVFVIGSNQPHVFRNNMVCLESRKKCAATLSLFFDDQVLGSDWWQSEEMKQALYFVQNSHCGYQIISSKRKQIADLLVKIAGADGIDRIIIFLQIIRLLSSTIEMQPLSPQLQKCSSGTFDTNRINSVFAFTFREFHRNIKLKEVAANAHLTVEAFCKYFKLRTGKTYINFLNELRIYHATELLQTNDLSVEEIACKCGFNNLSNFNRVFKQIKKTPPTEWRKLCKTNKIIPAR